MDLTQVAISPLWAGLAWILAIPLIVRAAWLAPWQHLSEGAVTRVWHGGIAIAVVLWSLQATVSGHFTFHLLAMAGLTLTLGTPLALVSAAVVVSVHCGIDGGLWKNVALVWLTLCAAPIVMIALILHLSERYLPPNLFIYIFVVAFFGTAFSMVTAGVLALLVLIGATELPVNQTFAEFAPVLLQLGFGEAMLTGMLITIGVVYRPQWVTTFDDTRYLKPR